MNDEHKEWQRQFWNNFGAKELIRLGLAYIAWILIGFAITRSLNNAGYLVIFMAILIGIFIYAPYWQPAYTILHKILGNRNIPKSLPRIKSNGGMIPPRFVALAIGLFIPGTLLFFGIRMIFFK